MTRIHLLAAAIGLLAALPAAAQQTIRIGHAQPDGTPLHDALAYFAEEVESRSDGDIQVDLFPGGQIGSVQEMADLVQSGNLTMTTGASVLMSSRVPALAVLDQFLLFDDVEQAHSVLDGEAGDTLAAAMEEQGIKLMGFMELGFRSFSNSRGPLDSAAAFEGLRMRSADNPIQITAWRSIGAVPVPLSWGEIYSSMQQGLIDGQESALSSMVTERFFEVQDYVSLTRHIYWPELWMADLNWWQGLDSDQQTLITEVTAEAVTRQREMTATANAEALDRLRDEGIEVNELPDAERAKMGETMNGAIESDIRERVGDDIYDAFMSSLDQQ